MVQEEFLLLASGMILLIAGAELLVRGASRLAAIAGISPLVIGLTVVAYGTSSPEARGQLEIRFRRPGRYCHRQPSRQQHIQRAFDSWTLRGDSSPDGLASADLAGCTDYDRRVGARIRGCFGRRHWSL